MIVCMHDTNKLDHVRQYCYYRRGKFSCRTVSSVLSIPFAECLQSSHFFSPLESMHVEDESVGQHPLVSQVLKEAFNERPPRPKYHSNWDINVQERR